MTRSGSGWPFIYRMERDRMTDDRTILPEGLLPFPSPEQVFADDYQHLAEHLLPLLSIQLDVIRPDDPAWTGIVHVLEPMEHVAGIVGEATGHAHGPLLRPNWIGFHLDHDRYRLAGDPRFFFLHSDNAHLPDTSDCSRPAMRKRRKIVQDVLSQGRVHYAAHGVLKRSDWEDFDDENPNVLEWYEQLGGLVDAYGNWVELGGFPMAYETHLNSDEEDEEYAFPLSPAGNKFHHVITVPGYCYVPDAACILVFFEPVERLVLMTFDWS